MPPALCFRPSLCVSLPMGKWPFEGLYWPWVSKMSSAVIQSYSRNCISSHPRQGDLKYFPMVTVKPWYPLATPCKPDAENATCNSSPFRTAHVMWACCASVTPCRVNGGSKFICLCDGIGGSNRSEWIICINGSADEERMWGLNDMLCVRANKWET